MKNFKRKMALFALFVGVYLIQGAQAQPGCRDIKAGSIGDNRQAHRICERTCKEHGAYWYGQWTSLFGTSFCNCCWNENETGDFLFPE